MLGYRHFLKNSKQCAIPFLTGHIYDEPPSEKLSMEGAGWSDSDQGAYTDSDDEYPDHVATAREHDGPRYKVIDKTTLLSAQCRDLKQIQDVLGIRLQHARSLLIHHRWDVENLFSALAEQGEERLFLAAGVPPRSMHRRASGPKEAEFTCGTCFDDVPADSATVMDCSHIYCNDCWTTYFLMKIREGQSRRITCMAHKCNAICDEEKVLKLVAEADPLAVDRYERSLLESYIEDNSKVKWCPSVPHCGNALRVEGEPYVEVQCTCGLTFCFNCGLEAHSPCSCDIWRRWDEKSRDESETVNWLVANTKPCPKCGKKVEKSGGCNLVQCTCKQPFCWLCGAATGLAHDWSRIEGHSCGRYKEDKEREAKKAETDLKRYMHYHTRWKGHMESLRLEDKQREVVQSKIAILEESESVVRDYSWLTNAQSCLFRARRVLAYSYAFAFYMFGSDLFKDDISPEQNEINQNLFEDHQQQLEATVERLAKLVETPFDQFRREGNDIPAIRMEVVNLTAILETRCKTMHEIVENDLLGSLQTTTHHIAPYYANVKPLPNEDSATGDDTDCGVGAAGVGPSTSHFDEEWREQGAVEDSNDVREPDANAGPGSTDVKTNPSSANPSGTDGCASHLDTERALKRPADSFVDRSPPHPAAKLPRSNQEDRFGGREHGKPVPPGNGQKGGTQGGGAGPSGVGGSQAGGEEFKPSCPVCFVEFGSGTDISHVTAHVEECLLAMEL
ncbi:hypothetical protein KFL_000840120 [Klebsormidium nitens]|uniref:RBR-type E3 ubiquitin transferase n=1 Tax=Klebsormidium nitens TaxID=105231 RepID=A0A1Y1HWJ8_KLENI|nr:hypothetical protein KFL_000840120 [Klebsormidium nitens]|eukprot:GAQ81569.1 hypothetical protein KFL_000840120 [Klebsormidium nitens]